MSSITIKRPPLPRAVGMEMSTEFGLIDISVEEFDWSDSTAYVSFYNSEDIAFWASASDARELAEFFNTLAVELERE